MKDEALNKKIIEEMNKEQSEGQKEAQKEEFQLSETWAQDIIEDLDDYIESMGHYLRQ